MLCGRHESELKAGFEADREAGREAAAMVPGVPTASASRWLGEKEWEGNARRLEDQKIP